jgi:hypothetical protein
MADGRHRKGDYDSQTDKYSKRILKQFHYHFLQIYCLKNRDYFHVF